MGARVPLIIEVDAEDPDCAEILADGTVAGRSYRFMIDTGAGRSQVVADAFTSTLPRVGTHTSTGVFGERDNDLIVLPDIALGATTMTSVEVSRVQPGGHNLLGTDVLGRHCCVFDFDAVELRFEAPGTASTRWDLVTDARGHCYIDVAWSGAVGYACWDSGAGITIVDTGFVERNGSLFTAAGMSSGTDVTGADAQTATFVMSDARIGDVVFAPHKVAAVDLSRANAGLDRRMDLILGYTRSARRTGCATSRAGGGTSPLAAGCRRRGSGLDDLEADARLCKRSNRASPMAATGVS